MRRDPLSFQLSTLSWQTLAGKCGRYKRERERIGGQREQKLGRKMGDRQGLTKSRLLLPSFPSTITYDFPRQWKQSPPSTWKSVVSTNTKYTMRLVIASSPRLASPDVVFPPRIALCVTFWSLHARCKPDGRTGRGHWRGGRVHELRVEGEGRRGYAMGIGWCAATCARRSLDRAKWKIKKKETKEKKEPKKKKPCPILQINQKNPFLCIKKIVAFDKNFVTFVFLYLYKEGIF